MFAFISRLDLSYILYHALQLKSPSRIETTMLPFEDDPLSAENLLEDSVNHFCKVLRFAHEWGPPIYPTGPLNIDERQTNVTHIDGMSCARNFSLHMIAIDSVRNHHFAESLGIDITNKKDMTAVVILDSKVRQFSITYDIQLYYFVIQSKM